MRARVRDSAAIVIALLALFVALGGPGYATTAVRRALAANADKVDGYHASKTPKPRTLLPLDRFGKLPASVLRLTAGPRGSVGAKGATGATGDQGAQGMKGDTGGAGKTVLNGAGVPSASTGTIGDFYVNTIATTLYGPKTASGWGSPVSLVGPAGTINGVSAGGDLTGTYPNPALKASAVTSSALAPGAVTTGAVSADTRGVALASVVVSPSGTVFSYFNREGGAPTVTHTATGWYDIVFPGINAWFISTVPVVTITSTTPALASASTSGGRFLVTTYNTSGGSMDAWFSLVGFPMSASG